MKRKILVTSGPTREWIDPVRYISNASSGCMGYWIAMHLLKRIQRDSELVYISGGTEPGFKTVEGARNLSVETTQDLLEVVLSELTANSLLVMAAAPADFRPKSRSHQKIKKENWKEGSAWILELERNPDILQAVADKIRTENWEQVVRIGFSAETQDLEAEAQAKLYRKDLDWIVGNWVGRGKGFGDILSQLICYSRKGERQEFGPDTKENLASGLVETILLPML